MNEPYNNEVLNKAARYRGWVINGTTMLERLIDVYLATYFVRDINKRDELFDMFLASSAGNINFESKRNLFVTLLKKHNKDFHSSNKDLFENIAWIIKQRNIFAHYLLDRTSQAEDRYKKSLDIGFIRFKEYTETVWWNDKMIKDLIDKIEDAIKRVNTLIGIPKDEL